MIVTGGSGGEGHWTPPPERHRRDTAGELRDSVERSLAVGGRPVHRLGTAGTSVTFLVVGAEDQSVTLLLDRQPPQVTDGSEPAEISIELDADQARRFARADLVLPNCILRGEVACRGPVRKYLSFDAILRGLLARANGTPLVSGRPPRADTRWQRAVAAAPAPGPPVAPDLPHAAAPASPAAAAYRESLPVPDLFALETRGLRKSFGSTEVLAGVDLQIPEGALATVLGPSGTGKSVLLKHIIGLLKPDAGEVLVRGRPLSRMSRSEVLALRRDIGVMFQDGALFSSMAVYDNVAFPLRQHTDLNEQEVRNLVEEQLEAVGLADAADRAPAELSGGMKKRAGLARSLVLDPGLVLADEPDSGLDPVRTALLGELLLERHSELGGTMLIVTHDTALARLVSDHVSLLWRGKIVESGPSEDVFASDDPFVRQFLAGEVAGPLGMDA